MDISALPAKPGKVIPLLYQLSAEYLVVLKTVKICMPDTNVGSHFSESVEPDFKLEDQLEQENQQLRKKALAHADARPRHSGVNHKDTVYGIHSDHQNGQ